MTIQKSILSTKTLTDEQRRLFVNAGFDLLEQDFIEVENINFELKNINQNLIFSSQNAVLSLIEQPNWKDLQDKNVFCVGIKTKQLLEEYGFTVGVYMDYASELAEIITLIYKNESFTFLSGNLRKETLPNALKNAKVTFNEIEVYQTKLTSFKISKEENFSGIMFFSPSGVESYSQNNTIKNETCFCIGETTAASLQKITKNSIIAETPTVEDLISKVFRYYNAIEVDDIDN
jgi:uroporphyrinogen-III synthase